MMGPPSTSDGMPTATRSHVADVQDHGDQQEGGICSRAVGQRTRLAAMTPAMAPLAPTTGIDEPSGHQDGDAAEEARQR